MITLHLPYGPTANTYWRHVGHKVIISAKGRAYRQSVAIKVREQIARGAFTATERLRVAVLVYPPDRRKRDLDNLGKALLDALTKAGVYGDDSQIDHLTFSRRERHFGGMVVVHIEVMDEMATNPFSRG